MEGAPQPIGHCRALNRLACMRELFRRFAHCTADAVGSPWAFVAGVGVTLIWACTGPLFRFSDTWQLVINTGTTIITFLMVFLIQSTQKPGCQGDAPETG